MVVEVVVKILIACEESQRVCEAFRKRGHEAYSCDTKMCSGGFPQWHIMQDCIPLLNGNCEFTTVEGGGGTCDSRQMGLYSGSSAVYVPDEQREPMV